MESKINYLWRQFEEFITTRHDLRPDTVGMFKACFYQGAFQCAWRISKHLTARGKNDAWMDELILELDEVIRHQAAVEFADLEPGQ